MPTTPKGITYPDSAAHTRLWEHFQALADTADAAIPAVSALQAGTESVSTAIPAGGSITVPVTFPQPFAAAPVVVPGNRGNTYLVVSISGAPTATGFTAAIRNHSGSSIASTQVVWIAVGV